MAGSHPLSILVEKEIWIEEWRADERLHAWSVSRGPQLFIEIRRLSMVVFSRSFCRIDRYDVLSTCQILWPQIS
jgi:hypothetical protein